ncbi:MAG: 1-deoxy-D-xylulose-5-phosphate synthase [Oscillospiraceae bacterium]|nr:1-deoxy-D-xylulose-5-phosphate synthase [Oscillospiraceae bacterium]
MLLNENINPARVKAMSLVEKKALAEEIRNLIISVVSKNGGHLSSNLGTVELTIAMHSVFETPKDSFIFDVGHQTYTHKILTGRFSGFLKLRQENGVSGFPRPSESAHDAFIGGHAGISVSAALGIAAAKEITGEQGSVVAVAGDGSFTSGGIYEGLNNAGKSGAKNFIVILNDNEMCISKSSGAFAAYLSQMRSTKKYYETKNRIKQILGKTASGAVSGAKRIVKSAIIPDNLFENLGFKYFGPLDGHNIEELINVLELVKTIEVPCLVHVKTKKGKGYIPAEKNAGHYHGLDKQKQVEAKKAETYSEVFGREIAKLGQENDKICLVTAAMKYATGCNYFAKKFPARFFDAGIAECHAVTFSAGLSSKGLLPVFAVYSTFLQRCFDQLLHDAAIENLRMVLCVDRAGLIGEDGPTHQGTFDTGMLMLIPGIKIYSPFTARELRQCLRKAVLEDAGISAVRYPRGIAPDEPPDEQEYKDYVLYQSEQKTQKLIITAGRISRNAVKLTSYGADVLKLIKIHPFPETAYEAIKKYSEIIFFEESYIGGSVAEKLSAKLTADGINAVYKMKAVEGFLPAADLETQTKNCGFDVESMKEFTGL